MQSIVISGNVSTGLHFVGPFPTRDAAIRWIELQDAFEPFWCITAPLIPPILAESIDNKASQRLDKLVEDFR